MQQVYTVEETDLMIAEQENISLALDARIKTLESHGSGDGSGILDVVDNGDGTMTVNLTDGRAFVIALPQGPMGPAGTGGGLFPVLKPGCTQQEADRALQGDVVDLLVGTYNVNLSSATCIIRAPHLKKTTIKGNVNLTGSANLMGATVNGSVRHYASGRWVQDMEGMFAGCKINGQLLLETMGKGAAIHRCRYPFVVTRYGGIKLQTAGGGDWINECQFTHASSLDAAVPIWLCAASGSECSGNRFPHFCIQPVSTTEIGVRMTGHCDLNEFHGIPWDWSQAKAGAKRLEIGSPCRTNIVVANLAGLWTDNGSKNGTQMLSGYWKTTQGNYIQDLSQT